MSRVPARSASPAARLLAAFRRSRKRSCGTLLGRVVAVSSRRTARRTIALTERSSRAANSTRRARSSGLTCVATSSVRRPRSLTACVIRNPPFAVKVLQACNRLVGGENQVVESRRAGRPYVAACRREVRRVRRQLRVVGTERAAAPPGRHAAPLPHMPASEQWAEPGDGRGDAAMVALELLAGRAPIVGTALVSDEHLGDGLHRLLPRHRPPTALEREQAEVVRAEVDRRSRRARSCSRTAWPTSILQMHARSAASPR